MAVDAHTSSDYRIVWRRKFSVISHLGSLSEIRNLRPCPNQPTPCDVGSVYFFWHWLLAFCCGAKQCCATGLRASHFWPTGEPVFSAPSPPSSLRCSMSARRGNGRAKSKNSWSSARSTILERSLKTRRTGKVLAAAYLTRERSPSRTRPAANPAADQDRGLNWTFLPKSPVPLMCDQVSHGDKLNP